MKLTDFQKQSGKDNKGSNWDLAFVVSVLLVTASGFVYDAYQEQQLRSEVESAPTSVHF